MRASSKAGVKARACALVVESEHTFIAIQVERSMTVLLTLWSTGGGGNRRKRQKDQGAQERIVQMGSILDLQVVVRVERDGTSDQENRYGTPCFLYENPRMPLPSLVN